MNDQSALMAHHDQTEQKLEADGGHDEQVDGGNAVGMITQKSKPSL